MTLMKKMILVLVLSTMMVIVQNRFLEDPEENSTSVSASSSGSTSGASASGSASTSTFAVERDSCESYLNNEEQMMCTEEWRNWCTYYSEEYCEEMNMKECYTSTGNTCQACNQKDAKYITYVEHASCPNVRGQPEPEPYVYEEPYYNEYECSDKDRNMMCNEDFKPVCVLEQECGSDNDCKREYSNRCSACSQKTVFVVAEISCKDLDLYEGPLVDPFPEPFPLPEPIYLHPFLYREACMFMGDDIDCNNEKFSGEVCAFEKDCNYSEKDCFKTFKNRCEACKETSIVEFTEGKCPEKKNCSNSDRGKTCDADYVEVCAVNSSKDGYEKFIDFGTTCQACAESNIDHVFEVPCYSMGTQFIDYFIDPLPLPIYEEYVCKAEERGQNCTVDNDNDPYNTVCAYKISCDNSDEEGCEIIEKSFCTACSREDIAKASTGPCLLQTISIANNGSTSIPRPASPLESFDYAEDADAGYKHTLSLQSTADLSVNSNNKAQYSTGVAVKNYSAKRCQSSWKTNGCPEIAVTTCAYKKCASGLCPHQFSGPCDACNDDDTDYYVEAPCKNVGSNRILIPCSSTEKGSSCVSNKAKVCGTYQTSSNLCMGKECGDSFSNNCDACNNTEVVSYYKGECFSKWIASSFITALLLLLL